jgi:hypothetical protein
VARAGLSRALAGLPPVAPSPIRAPEREPDGALLAVFEARQEEALREQRERAERRLLAAATAIGKVDPTAPRVLAEVLAGPADAAPLRAEYLRRVCTGWLRLCSALSLGPRAAGEPAMPNANLIGGSPAAAWRRAYPGFIEIEVDFPEWVQAMRGVMLGKLSVASEPSTVRLLRHSGRTLTELPVYRRLWLGSHQLDRSPDVVITPEQQIEVNTRSALLAAIALSREGRLHDLLVEGIDEERERAGLLDRAEAAGGERTAQERQRLAVLDVRRYMRATAAIDGASTLWSWIGAVPASRLP